MLDAEQTKNGRVEIIDRNLILRDFEPISSEAP